jgi:hypothetical protein
MAANATTTPTTTTMTITVVLPLSPSLLLSVVLLPGFVGARVGPNVGSSVGETVGPTVGDHVGADVGAWVGADVGAWVGADVGAWVGVAVGGSHRALGGPLQQSWPAAAKNAPKSAPPPPGTSWLQPAEVASTEF